jgi:hypothetical protein
MNWLKDFGDTNVLGNPGLKIVPSFPRQPFPYTEEPEGPATPLSPDATITEIP